MSWSLQLRGGDLVLDGTRLGSVTGSNKLIQDLRCTILERMGTDDSHPWFGSLIDGGIQNGQEVPTLIASSNWSYVMLQIEAEIRRIADLHQKSQIQRLERDKSTYGKPTLTSSELLMGIGDIQFYQAQDNMLIQIVLIVGNERNETINIPLSTQGQLV